MLAFLCGIQLARWLNRRSALHAERKISEEYFRGLNYLLNEEPDKAIEVFIKAIEVDSETVELHLALGGLFRRKGQIDRATRVHQNLIARPHLSDQHRVQAIYELAQDYDHAGLLDRAENLYTELMDSPQYRSLALEGLEKIYRREKEWRKAIDIVLLHRRQDKPELGQSLAQYWCELAEEAIDGHRFLDATKALKNAALANPESVRTVQLKGDLAFAQGHHQVAIKEWRSLCTRFPSLIDLVIEKVDLCFKHEENPRDLSDFYAGFATLPKMEANFEIWFAGLAETMGTAGAQAHLVELVTHSDVTEAAAQCILSMSERNELQEELEKKTLNALLEKAKQANLQYTCGVCGFGVKSIHWHCPNCGRWETFS